VISTLRIATRGSLLALWQADYVKGLLERFEPGLRAELLVIKTSGDKLQDVALAPVGGKGLFVKEIEEALLDGRADLAVHSMKDVPVEVAAGLTLAAVSQRADPRDALCARHDATLAELPARARIGTSSLRRTCQLLARRPDLEIVSLRGNVPTRLARLDAGDCDAVLLAVSGLERLGMGERISEKLPLAVCLPAVGQGALAIEARERDVAIADLLRAAVHHPEDARRVAAERAFLARIQGGCQAPLAGHARFSRGELVLTTLVGSRDGSTILRDERRGSAERAEELGQAAADALLGMGGARLLAAAPLT
jgi:hydroxymethylbilane synthase